MIVLSSEKTIEVEELRSVAIKSFSSIGDFATGVMTSFALVCVTSPTTDVNSPTAAAKVE
jgi:hypothetical protein